MRKPSQYQNNWSRTITICLQMIFAFIWWHFMTNNTLCLYANTLYDSHKVPHSQCYEMLLHSNGTFIQILVENRFEIVLSSTLCNIHQGSFCVASNSYECTHFRSSLISPTQLNHQRFINAHIKQSYTSDLCFHWS